MIDEAPKCPRCGKPAKRMGTDMPDGRPISMWVFPCDCAEVIVAERNARDAHREAVEALFVGGFPEVFIAAARKDEIDVAKLEQVALEMSATQPKRRASLLLLGEVGTGKTWSGCYVAWTWAKAGRKRVLYIPLPAMVSKIDRRDLLDRVGRMDLVHVDDVGYQKREASDFVFALVDAAYRAGTPVIYTTSQSKAGILRSLGADETAKAVMDRMQSGVVAYATRKESLR